MRNKQEAITLSYFDLGQIMSLIWGERIYRLSKPLQYRLRIAMAQGYIDHPALKDEARRDIKKYTTKLNALTKIKTT